MCESFCQVSTSQPDEMGMLVFLSIVGMGMFLLVLALAFLAARLARQNDGQDDVEKIIDPEDESFDSVENERAIFIIGEMDKFDTEDIVIPRVVSEKIKKKEESDGDAAAGADSKQRRIIVNTMKLLRYTNRWMQGFK